VQFVGFLRQQKVRVSEVVRDVAGRGFVALEGAKKWAELGG